MDSPFLTNYDAPMAIHPFDSLSDPSPSPVPATESDADLADALAAALPVVEDESEVRNLRDAWEIFVRESMKLWWIATPIAFSIVCLYGINSTTQIFAGHLGNLELSAVAIGLSVISNFSFGFLLGMGSALETLCGQAFGAGQVDKLGIYMQRSWIILTASAVLMCPVYLFAAPLLKLIGQDPDIADAAGRFTVAIIPQIFALAINFPTQKFLQAQSKVWVLACIGFAALLLHIALLSLFLYGFGWGIIGAAAAYDISQWAVSVAQVAYVVRWCGDGWGEGFSWGAFRDLWAFVKLSLASAVMLCLEIWYMMVLVVLAGHLHRAQIAVGSISICMNISGWEGMVFIGINAAISVRVSNELGSGRPRATKHAVAVVVATSLVVGLCSMFLILAARNKFPVIFTSDEELQRAVSKIAHLLALTMVLNSIQPVISGVAVGGGWQALVAYINLACYYVFGLPLGFLLGYALQWGVQGIWVGMLLGTALQTFILCYVLWKTNWNDEAAQACERVKLWGGEGKFIELELGK
ncbi:protein DETOXIFICATION 35-like [Phalaenopsis equestris]|uniref:protein DETOXIFICATION 35-like n=1 Tax=Phalaenopsis equestris TaxID=78828 RepID=UPI0009E50A1A|nr:protein DETOXIFICATION 35-like [Phalaenopsis equestris]